MRHLILGTAVLLALAAASEDGTNRGLATLASAVLPGTGQMMLGNSARGELQVWLDGAMLAAWAGTSLYGSSREEDARLGAARDCGADLSMNDPAYFKALERYDNVQEYYEDVRRQARDRYPDDPAAQRDYYESRRYPSAAEWDWSSDSARFDYWRGRRSARSAAQAAGFAAGALLLNRIISVVDCVFFAGPGERDARLEAAPTQGVAGIELRYRF
ncbi:hypothetical protein JXB37_03065 [candidate division WOR-3 bacterium]|nr:hypothetical protein [candidate division WOR-3 bacterium]